MTIASELTKLNTNLTNAYTAVDGKGGTLPQAQNFDNLATAINSIPSGTTPTGTLSITANGVYDVTNYASADVSVSGEGVSGTTYYLYPHNDSGGYDFIAMTLKEFPDVGDSVYLCQYDNNDFDFNIIGTYTITSAGFHSAGSTTYYAIGIDEFDNENFERYPGEPVLIFPSI